MARTKISNGVSLGITGSSGNTSILGTQQLSIKANEVTKGIALYTKNKPISKYLKQDTNWNAGLSSQNFNSSFNPNSVSNGVFEFSWKDFSSDNNDAYYAINKGQVGIDYTVSAEWETSSIDICDNFALVGTDNWTSSEKLIWEYNVDDATLATKGGVTRHPLHSYMFARYDNTIINPPTPTYYPISYTITSFTVYNYQLQYYINVYCPVTVGGTLTITYDYNGGTQTVTQGVPVGGVAPDYDSYTKNIYISTTTPYPTTGGIPNAGAVQSSFDGSPSSVPITGPMCPPQLTLLSTTTHTIATEDPIPNGAVRSGNFYYFPPNTAGSGKIIIGGTTVYDYYIGWNINGCSKALLSDGYIEILVEYQGSYTKQRASVSSNTGLGPIRSTTDPRITRPTITFTGSPYNWPDTCVNISFVTESTINIPGYIPAGSIIEHGYYYPPLEGTRKASKFILNNTWFLSNQLNLFWNTSGEYGWYTAGVESPGLAYLDYSDIFIEITYSTLNSPNVNDTSHTIIRTDVTSSTATKRYKFDGYSTLQQFTNAQSNLNGITYVDDDETLTWKIIVGPKNEFIGIELSSHQDWEIYGQKTYTSSSATSIAPAINPRFLIDAWKPNSFNYDLIREYQNYLFIDAAIVDVKSVKFFKVINFPNCGKVDLYQRKTGVIYKITGNIFTVLHNHGMKNGDRIKMIGVTSEIEGTNLNDVFYVKVINSNDFILYADKDLTSLVSPYDVKSYVGMRYVCVQGVDGSTWAYKNTIYSPMGKNGYSSATPQLLSYVETPQNAVNDPIERSVEYIMESPGKKLIENNRPGTYYNYYSDRNLYYPQAWVNGARSWNNFYPYQRNRDLSAVAISLRNGNSFGSVVKIKSSIKNNNNPNLRVPYYYIMVTEPGADESFELFDGPPLLLLLNEKVIPTYLPYGRIHFYKLTNNFNEQSDNYTLSYITSFSNLAYNGPWAANEKYLQTARQDPNNIPNYQHNISLNSLAYANTNPATNNYWDGARFVSWTKDFIYDAAKSFYFPNLNANTREYPFLDCLGKGADFEIVDNNIYVVASTNVKYGMANGDPYLNHLYPTYTYAKLEIVSNGLNLLYKAISTIETPDIVNNIVTNFNTQTSEFRTFGLTVQLNDGRLFIGWPSANRGYEAIYRAERMPGSLVDDHQYVPVEMFYSDGEYGFGEYFVSQGNFLIANKRDYYDDNGNLTTNPLDYLQVYRYHPIEDKYIYTSRLSTTINILDERYSTVGFDTYELTTNLSYDRTTTASATYIASLAYRYDVYNNMLFVRDTHELSIFKYNDSIKAFDNVSHDFVRANGKILDTSTSILKVAPSFAPATYDAVSEVDNGGYSRSIQIIDASRFLETTYNNYITSIDSQNLEYLSLYIKQIEGSGVKSVDTFIHGHDVFSGTMELYTQGPMQSSGSMELFLEPLHSKTGVMTLHTGANDKWTSRQALFLANKQTANDLTLSIIFDPRVNTYMPLNLGQPIVVGPTGSTDSYGNPATNITFDNTSPLFLRSEYEGKPNHSSVMPLNISTLLYDDYGSPAPLYLYNQNPVSSGLSELYIMSSGNPGSYSSTELFINSSGDFMDGIMPLIIGRETAQNLDLMLYNADVSGNMNMYISGVYSLANGLTLTMQSGIGYINTGVTIHTKGTTL